MSISVIPHRSWYRRFSAGVSPTEDRSFYVFIHVSHSRCRLSSFIIVTHAMLCCISSCLTVCSALLCLLYRVNVLMYSVRQPLPPVLIHHRHSRDVVLHQQLSDCLFCFTVFLYRLNGLCTRETAAALSFHRHSRDVVLHQQLSDCLFCFTVFALQDSRCRQSSFIIVTHAMLCCISSCLTVCSALLCLLYRLNGLIYSVRQPLPSVLIHHRHSRDVVLHQQLSDCLFCFTVIALQAKWNADDGYTGVLNVQLVVHIILQL
ncbi:hypothetical protein J6590_077262 [Homalodisca vitripennis]|nr:hypothetical protein J6590_077262 [Homalodisca vitripennis]